MSSNGKNGNSNGNRYHASAFISAIPGTGGIISTIAARVGCDWHTAKRNIEKYPTVKQAYEDECERTLDVAESVILSSIQTSRDLASAKWYLTRKGKHRGYGDKTELDISNALPLPAVTEVIVRLPEEQNEPLDD